ncbi:glycosyltransferase, partial [Desulfovibrio sp. OttesenSCG-928-F20]|nr:glycosyltransferase [Desulfovibrio sp. OttesenSCG-928-F20]
MKVLFIHQNFPGQYLHLAQYLHNLGHEVVGLGETDNIKKRGAINGITTIGYPAPQGSGQQTHHYLLSTEAAVRRGQNVVRALLEIKAKHFTPDVISLHPGWGEGLFVRDVFPHTPIAMFCEYYFRAGQADLGFDPEFPQSPDWSFSIRIRNTAQVMSLITANVGLSPTQWQASRYPDFIRRNMVVAHDGVNTDYMTPDASDSLTIQPLDTPGDSRLVDYPPFVENPAQGVSAGDAAAQATLAPAQALGPPITLGVGDKVITYTGRNLEPYRGVHIFLRALPELQRRHPDAHVLIIGHDGVSYSPALPEGETYKAKYLAELKGRIDLSRVHFLGRIPYMALRSAFRISSAHVYLTYPFVLSWSMLEAMSCEALLVASDTPPVREMISHGENGLLFDFFDTNKLVDSLDAALNKPEQFRDLRKKARIFVEEHFRLEKCLQTQLSLLEALAGGRYPAPY